MTIITFEIVYQSTKRELVSGLLPFYFDSHPIITLVLIKATIPDIYLLPSITAICILEFPPSKHLEIS